MVTLKLKGSHSIGAILQLQAPCMSQRWGPLNAGAKKMRIRHTLYCSDRRQLLLERALGHLGAEIRNGMVSDTCHGHL